MKNFFTTFVAITAIASAQDAEYCCELFTEENFEGYIVTACLYQNWWGERMSSTAVSFYNCLQDDGVECCEGQHIMSDNMESYRCGSKVNASFCEGYPYKEWNQDQLRYDHRCRTNYEVFSTDGTGGDFQSSLPPQHDNQIDSIVLTRARVTSACDGNYRERGFDQCMNKVWRCPTLEEKENFGDCGWIYTANDGTHHWIGCDQDDGVTLCHDIWR